MSTTLFGSAKRHDVSKMTKSGQICQINELTQYGCLNWHRVMINEKGKYLVTPSLSYGNRLSCFGTTIRIQAFKTFEFMNFRIPLFCEESNCKSVIIFFCTFSVSFVMLKYQSTLRINWFVDITPVHNYFCLSMQ